MTELKKVLEETFSSKSEEYQIIVESYDLISKTAPTIASEAKTHMLLLDHARVKLSSLYYLLSRSISQKQKVFRSSYDAQYSRLVKLGRPSNAAIEAEIRATNTEYATLSYEIEKLEHLKEMINSYLRCVDASKVTSLEVLRDSRRLD